MAFPGVWDLLRYRRLGLYAAARWWLLRSAFVQQLSGPLARIRPARLRDAVAVRFGSSDVDVFENIFVDRELEFCEQIAGPVQWIIDLGANVGYASAWFLNAFPDASVTALEPDPANCEMCRTNLAPYGRRATVVEGAIWHSCATLGLSRGTFGDGREWATEVKAQVAGGLAVQSLDMPTLLSVHPSLMVDLLKIDIEGSEVALFSSGTERWLDRVRNLAIELHGAEAYKTVFTALREYDFEPTHSGEYMVFTNLRRKVPALAELNPNDDRPSSSAS